MQAKSVMYAAVGAPVVAARKVSGQVGTLRDKVGTERSTYTKAAEKAINGWATEGEKFLNKVSEGKVVEEISSKVDLEQAKEQVTKLRDQLEDMLATWRTSFRPEKSVIKPTETAPVSKPVAKKPVARTSSAKTTAAAKKPTAKATAAKPKAAKKPAARTSADKAS